MFVKDESLGSGEGLRLSALISQARTFSAFTSLQSSPLSALIWAHGLKMKK